jgi:putative toxin-antitoxin system antitoxin component (TIGR02293 family)
VATNPNIAEYIGVNPKSGFDLARMIEDGLSSDSLPLLRKKGLTFTEVAELIISPRTLQHRKAKGVRHLTHDEADRVVRVARILLLADQTFGNPEKALGWLREPDDRLNNRTALSLLKTESGGRLVEEMLWQIREGMFS